MVASTSTAVPSTQNEDGSLQRAVLGRTTHEVKDYNAQLEDQCKITESLGTAFNAPENKSVLDILEMRERRLDAALDKEANATKNLTNYCIAEKSAVQAQSEATIAPVRRSAMSLLLLLLCHLNRPVFPRRRL